MVSNYWEKTGTYDIGFEPDFPAMEVQYHRQCKKEYFNKFSLACCLKKEAAKIKRQKMLHLMIL